MPDASYPTVTEKRAQAESYYRERFSPERDAYFGAIIGPHPENPEWVKRYWECEHRHRTRAVAQKCADKHLQEYDRA